MAFQMRETRATQEHIILPGLAVVLFFHDTYIERYHTGQVTTTLLPLFFLYRYLTKNPILAFRLGLGKDEGHGEMGQAGNAATIWSPLRPDEASTDGRCTPLS